MNSKNRSTLAAINEQPTRRNILWKDIEALMFSIGATIKEGKGSAGVFILNKRIFPFHRPHPQKEAKKYQIEDIRRFLEEEGVGKQ